MTTTKTESFATALRFGEEVSVEGVGNPVGREGAVNGSQGFSV